MSEQQTEAVKAITAQLAEIVEHLDSIKDLVPALLSPGTPSATDAPVPAQKLADLEPCLGDRVRAYRCRGTIEDFTYGHHAVGGYGWSAWLGQSVVMEAWTILERLDPVTPEEPPVGSGILVDAEGDLWRLGKNGWHCRHHGGAWWAFGVHWKVALNEGPLRPATPADLARHGVDEQGEPVGEGEADDEHLATACDWSDFRKDYGVSSAPELMQREHRAFLAGWQAGRHGDQSGVLR